jgi:hypothetical protein
MGLTQSYMFPSHIGFFSPYWGCPLCDTAKNIPHLTQITIITSKKECSVCLENEPDHIITTCWHKCLCYKCGSGLKRCPICRKKFDYKTELKKVFE